MILKRIAKLNSSWIPLLSLGFLWSGTVTCVNDDYRARALIHGDRFRYFQDRSVPEYNEIYGSVEMEDLSDLDPDFYKYLMPSRSSARPCSRCQKNAHPDDCYSSDVSITEYSTFEDNINELSESFNNSIEISQSELDFYDFEFSFGSNELIDRESSSVDLFEEIPIIDNPPKPVNPIAPPKPVDPITPPKPVNPIAPPKPVDPTATATLPVDPTSTPPVDPTSTPPVDPTSTSPVDPTSTPPVDPTSTPPVDPTSTPPVDPTSTPPVDPTSTPPVDPTVQAQSKTKEIIFPSSNFDPSTDAISPIPSVANPAVLVPNFNDNSDDLTAIPIDIPTLATKFETEDTKNQPSAPIPRFNRIYQHAAFVDPFSRSL